MRKDGRSGEQLRPISITRRFTQAPAGSVLWKQGQTVILATASITPDVPPWFRDDRPGGWLTADYVMLPGSTPSRKDWPRIGHTDSRGTEIQRIIGRSIRAIIDLSKIGPHTIHVDCQVLQADGGTRTASICAAYVALADAVLKLPKELPNAAATSRARSTGGFGIDVPPAPTIPAKYDPQYYAPADALIDELAAVSVGFVDGELRVDLDYSDDSRASVDLNVAYTGSGRFVEIQGSAENGAGFDRAQTDRMLDAAVAGCTAISKKIRDARSVALESLTS